MKEIFMRQDTPYSLKCNLRLKIHAVRALSCGIESTQEPLPGEIICNRDQRRRQSANVSQGWVKNS